MEHCYHAMCNSIAVKFYRLKTGSFIYYLSYCEHHEVPSYSSKVICEKISENEFIVSQVNGS